jgi:O-succinylbenzoic acid--CoA ligase
MRDWLAATAALHPTKTALLRPHDDFEHLVKITYARLNELAASEAAALAQLGVESGDRVGLLLDNGQRYVSLVWGLVRRGAVLVPLNTRLTADELRYQVDKAGCKLIICSSTYEPTAVAIRTRPVYTVGSSCSDAALPFPTNIMHSEAHLDGEIDLDATAAIIFTSGTTGKPKGAQLTFGNLYHSAQASAERLGVHPDDRWLLALPLYHVGGLSILFRSAIYGTAFAIPQAEPGASPKLESIIHTMQREAITLISLVPTQLYRMIQAGVEFPPTLRLILLGGAAAAPDLLESCAKLNLPVATTYGLTEAASQVATMSPEDVRHKPGSVGKPLAGTQVRIVREDGTSAEPGEYGEIAVSGKMVMKGYLDEPLSNGELYTGDIGYLDADGDLWLVQRRSDLIVSGGENVYPAEVEGILRQHPMIAEAAVVGVPSAEWGQQVAAVLVLKPGTSAIPDDIEAFCKARLAGYKRPRLIRFVSELPMTASGKIQRSAVRALFENPPSQRHES